MTALDTFLKAMPDRCSGCGHHLTLQHCTCPGTEWAYFKSVILAAADPAGIIHQSVVRPRLRGRVEPKHVGTFYRRAKAEGLIRDTGEREPSDDAAGRNQDKLDRIYELAVAA